MPGTEQNEVTNSTDSHSSISENEPPWSSYILICFGHQWTFHSCNISERVTQLSPKATVIISKFLWHFPPL